MTKLHVNRVSDRETGLSHRRAVAASRTRLHADYYLWGIYIMLLIFSVVELYSASSAEVRSDNVYQPLLSHLLFLSMGLLVAMGLSRLHFKWIRKTAWLWFWGGVGLCVLSYFFGLNLNGAMRAIRVGGITIQPPEIAKLCVVVVLARILSKNQIRHGVKTKGILLAAGVLVTYVLLLFRDGLTNAAILGMVAVAMFVIGGIQWQKFLLLAIVAVVAGGTYYMATKDGDAPQGTARELTAAVPDDGGKKKVDRGETRSGRVNAYLAGVSPTDDITDQNRQVIFARMAQAHGHIRGAGPGNSRESARLPLAFSDYIYSIIVEDTGFIGGVLLLILYMWLMARAGIIASKCTKAFPALLITGCATLITGQALVHMAIVTGLGPVSGQPLPFISKGGTSILVMSAAMGMMLSVSRYAVQKRKSADDKEELKEAVGDATDTSLNPSQLTYETI